MKRYLFYAIGCVVFAVVFMYLLNARMERMNRNRDYAQKFGMEAYLYKTVVRVVIFIAILVAIGKLLY
jgi:ABC-type enterochelin transport system permease subunit